MMDRVRGIAGRVLAIATVLALAGCGLPRSGPTTSEILAGSVDRGGTIQVVIVDDRVARAANLVEHLGFSRSFLNAGLVSVERINPGDVLSITVWENLDDGLFVNRGESAATLPPVRVDELGNIFIPYVGTVRASGRTPEELRVKITEELAGRTPDPQVEVRRQAGEGASVTVMGGVAAQGVYPIEAATRRLAAMLARAGGVQIEPRLAQIVVRRGGETGRVWLQQLVDDPTYDIPLRANDQIFVEEARRSFTVLGSASGQAVVTMPAGDVSVLDALASIGGLSSSISDPRGIFVFRNERPEIVARVLGSQPAVATDRLAYVVDLTGQAGIFTARDFLVRDGDAIYVAEAPFVTWQRFLSVLANGTGAFADINTIVEALQ